MSLLVIQLPPRERLGARAPGPEGGGAPRLPSEWRFVHSSDGRSVGQTGSVAAALLPRADTVMLLLGESDLSWHRVNVPKAPAARLRAALAGVMEEALLDEDEALHLALGPDAAPGRPGWVAATHRPRLAAALAALEAHGLSMARVIPAAGPTAGEWRGHFHTEGPVTGMGPGAEATPWLTLAGDEGVVCVNLAGTLARQLLPPAGTAVRWSASPAAAAAAERWLGVPVPVLDNAERALEAAGATVNLRQFDLAQRTRGTRALRDIGRRLLSHEWRAVRAGLAALLLLQVVGLNAYAWQQRQALQAKRQAMHELLLASHPGVRTVLDAPLQMARESERLRAAAGRPGESDLETLLAAAAAAWPDGLGPVQSLRFEPGRLTLAANGWGEPQLQQFRQRLRAAGLQAELADGQVTVARAVARGAA